ncbi:SGNH/GDSL hydrolase family protein [Fodinicola acaciae]|uniref:SGNH/GDSL hydrolase family protein n=1 Tax=Fodinicola acaciae TaxID=2681555 RepID=UPI0013D44DEC|nr:SGNH/GDSL hydrolase family protein [Fodinicola acaciae]
MRGRAVLLFSVLLVALFVSPAGAATGYREYVALGDSWTADVNILNVATTFVPYGCVQSAADYPHQVAKTLGIATFTDASCGGATTDHMTKPQSAPLGGTNPPQFDRLTPTTDLVTVGIGGNDAGLVGVVTSCIRLLPLGKTCQSTYVSGGVDKVSQAIAAAAPKIAATVAGIKARSPHARIVLVNYMNPIPSVGCYPYIQISNKDVPWLRAKLAEMNAAIATVAANAQVGVANTDVGMAGHDVCQLPNKQYVTALLPLSTDPLVAVPFHPTQLGADHQAAVVSAYLTGGSYSART